MPMSTNSSKESSGEVNDANVSCDGTTSTTAVHAGGGVGEQGNGTHSADSARVTKKQYPDLLPPIGPHQHESSKTHKHEGKALHERSTTTKHTCGKRPRHRWTERTAGSPGTAASDTSNAVMATSRHREPFHSYLARNNTSTSSEETVSYKR
jgi:hypothetical protein